MTCASTRGKDGQGLRLHLASALWGQNGYTYLGEFLDTMVEN